MAAGILGGLDYILSGSKRKISRPNLFGAGTVGGGWADYLKNLYATPTEQSGVYRSQSTALRDALSQESATQGDQFSQASNAGGFYDSGARFQGLNDINRNRLMSYSQGLTQILTNLENQKMQAAFPFLQAQMGEFTGYQNAVQGAENAQNVRSGQNKQFVSDTFGSLMGSMGGGG